LLYNSTYADRNNINLPSLIHIKHNGEIGKINSNGVNSQMRHYADNSGNSL
jgi:hypothetical protein